MKIETLDDGTLVVEERLTLLRWGTAIGALALVAVLAFAFRARGLSMREVLGGAAGFLLLSCLAAFLPDRLFRFEPARQRLTWSVRRLFASRSGEMLFSDVLRVAQRLSLDTDSRVRAIECQPILVTRTGEIPLSSTQSIRAADWTALTAAISRVLGRDTAAPATPETLAGQGGIVGAVALLRRRAAAEGAPLSLTAAKAEVDRLRAEAGPDSPTS